jgi:hypothetical protein
MLRPLAIATQSPTKATKKAVGLKSTLESITSARPVQGPVEAPLAKAAREAKEGPAVLRDLFPRTPVQRQMDKAKEFVGPIPQQKAKPIKFLSPFGEVEITLNPEMDLQYRFGDVATRQAIIANLNKQAIEVGMKQGRPILPQFRNTDIGKAIVSQVGVTPDTLPQDERFRYDPYVGGDMLTEAGRFAGNALSMMPGNIFNLRATNPAEAQIISAGADLAAKEAYKFGKKILPDYEIPVGSEKLSVNELVNPVGQGLDVASRLADPESGFGETALYTGMAAASAVPGFQGLATGIITKLGGATFRQALAKGLLEVAREGLPAFNYLERKTRVKDLANILERGGMFEKNADKIRFQRQIEQEAKDWASKNSKNANEFLEQQDEFYNNLLRTSLDQAYPPVPGRATRGAANAIGGPQFQPVIRGGQPAAEFPPMFDTPLPSATDTRRTEALAGELAIPEGDRYQQLIPDLDGFIPEFVPGAVNIAPDGVRFDTQAEYYAYYMAHNAYRALTQLPGVTGEVATQSAVLLSKLFKFFAEQPNGELNSLRTVAADALKGVLPENALPQLEKIIEQGLESTTGQIPGAIAKTGDEDSVLLEVAKEVEKVSRENPIFPPGTKFGNLPDDEIIEGIKQATIKEVAAWMKSRKKMKKPYVSFYLTDVQKANKILQAHAKTEYGRELTDNEVDFYHLVSSFASPSNAPVNDSNVGFQIFDRWMKSGQKDFSVYGHNYKTIWEQIFTPKGWKKTQTEFAALDEAGNLQPTKFTPAYYAGGMDRVKRLIDKLGFDDAMEFLRTKHSFDDIVKNFQLTKKEIESLSQHEYLTKADGGYGIFGIGDAPKLGSYVLNRWQNFETITKDMWVARTMARMFGEPLVKGGEVIKEPWKLTKEGVRMRRLLDDAWTAAADEFGMDPAMIQEAMWDIEQVIYNAFGNPRTASYVSEGLQNGIDVTTGKLPTISNKEALLEGMASAPPAKAYIEARPGVGPFKQASDKAQQALIDEIYNKVFKGTGKNSFVDKLVTLVPGAKNIKKPVARKTWGYYEGRWSPNIELQFQNAEDGRLASAVLGKLFVQDAVPLSALSPYREGLEARVIKYSVVKNTDAERRRVSKILKQAVDANGKKVPLGATYNSNGELVILNLEKAVNFDDIALRIAGGDEYKVRSFMKEAGEYYDRRIQLKYDPETGKGFTTGTFEEVLKTAESKGGLVDPVTGKPVRKKLFESALVEPLREAYKKVQTDFGFDPARIDEKILQEAELIKTRLKLKQENTEGIVRGFYDLAAKTITLVKGEADVDTLFHEVGHHLKEVLLAHPEHGATIRRIYGDTADELGHERFANDVVAYIREGTMPAKGLRGVFESVKNWMRSMAKTYAGNNIDPELKKILDNIYGEEDAVTKALMNDLTNLGKKADDTTTTTKATGSVAGGVRGDARILPTDLRTGTQAAEAAREADGSLKGLPRKVAGVTYAHHAPAENVARRYMESKGLPYNPPSTYAKVDPERARKIADAYEAMKHDPTNPEVKAAYEAMAKETLDQYNEIVKEGIKIEFFDPAKGDPYAGNPNNVFDDVKRNKHMWVYPTSEGYGTTGYTAEDILNNPLLADSGIKWNGQPTTINDIFRAVHDYFGHIKEGVGFRANGEENAWRAHSAMYSDEARKAMTSETRGQNSWVNFGPESATNRGANQLQTTYAEQKVGLLPDWAINEGRADDFVPTTTVGPAKPVVSGKILTQTEKEPDLIATANRITEEVRKSVGLDGATKATPEQIADWTEEARKINTSKLMNDMMSGTGNLRPLSKAEELAVGARLSRALERYSSALDELRTTDTPSSELLDRIDSARSEIDEISKFSLAVGTEWGKSGVARQALIRADYTTAGVITRFRKQEKLVSKDSSMAVQATKQEMADAEEFARISREKDDKIAALEKKIEDLKAQGAKEAPKRRLELRRQKLESERDDILSQIMGIKSGEKKVPQPKMTGESGAINIADDVALFELYGKLAKNAIQRGALTVEDVYVYVSEVAKQAGHTLTKQGMIDALDAQMLKNRRVGAKRATKAELRARQRLYREVERGATRNVAEREREIAAREITRKAREEAIQIKKDEIAAKREAIRAERDAQKATSKAEADAYRAAAKQAREEARALAKQLREAERKAKLDARQARRAELTEALGPIARDERKIANLKGRIEDYNRMIESGEFFASRALKEGDEGYELTHLQTQLEQLRYEAKVAKQNVDTIIDDLGQPAWKKVFKEVIELPRYMQLGLDAGALTRQGFDIALVSPTAWTKAAKRGFGAAISNPAKVARLEEEFMRDPEVLKAIANGLAIDGPSDMPEGFISKAAQKIPGYGRGERFHKTFQNFARYETYRNLTRGQNMNQYQLKETAKLINAMTGRGGWKGAEGKLASIFTAPKMYAGQLEVMGKTATAIVDPRFRTNPAYRKLIVRRWLGRMGGIVALKALADATDWEFSINPDDSDFLKLRNGNTVIDVTGGYSSWYKLLFSTLNDVAESGMSEGFTDKLVRSLGYKVSPTVRTPLSFITGKDAIGKPFFTNPDTGEREMNVQDLAKTFAPLIGMQIYEMAGGDEGYADMDNPAKVALGGLGFIGTGVSNYEPRDPSRKPEDTKWGQFLESAGIQPR